jgi:hypothetical protein
MYGMATLLEADDADAAFARYLKLRFLAISHPGDGRLHRLHHVAARRLSRCMQLDAEQRTVVDADLERPA